MPSIGDARILIIATHGVEQSELTEPRDRLRRQGARVDVASPDGRPIRGWQHTDWGDMLEVDLRIADADPSDYTALVLPGGQMNPDTLRINEDAMRVVRTFLADGKLVAAVCHGPWLLVEADAVRDREVTSWPSLRTDIRNAGGEWVDREVVVDDGVITSRKPDDLPAFAAKIVEEIEADRHRAHSAA